MRLGKVRSIKDAVEMSDEFLAISRRDEDAAELLCQNGFYNQSIYYYIQSMEKYIKGYICKKINIANPHSAKYLRKMGHSLDETLELFIEIAAGKDELLKNQMMNQINKILKGIYFNRVYNLVRYPFLDEKKGGYFITEMSNNDCNTVKEIFICLKKYIRDYYLTSSSKSPASMAESHKRRGTYPSQAGYKPRLTSCEAAMRL